MACRAERRQEADLHSEKCYTKYYDFVRNMKENQHLYDVFAQALSRQKKYGRKVVRDKPGRRLYGMPTREDKVLRRGDMRALRRSWGAYGISERRADQADVEGDPS